MADRRNSESDREAMLRRVAIVLSSLPAPVAAQLLGSIDPQTKQAVRRTMTSLADVDPLERQRALRAFQVSVEKQPAVRTPKTVPDNKAIEDEFEISSSADTSRVASRVVSSSVSVTGSAEDSPPPASPLSFLGDVRDDTLVSLLAVEHPQAVALVLASIAPAQAARVLPRLEPRLQADALSRIGRLGDVPEAAATEIAEHFRQRLSQNTSYGRSASGQRALDAILAAMPKPVAAPVARPQSDPQTAHHAPHDLSHPPIAPATFPSADVPAIDLAHKLRVAEHTLPESHDAGDRPIESTSARQVASQPTGPTQTEHDLSNENVVSEAQVDRSASGRPRAWLRVDRRDQSTSAESPACEFVPSTRKGGYPERNARALRITKSSCGISAGDPTSGTCKAGSHANGDTQYIAIARD